MDAPLCRFDRLIALLLQLQTRPVVRAQDLADQYGVSARTIYRDLRTLEAAGVPLAAEAGVGFSLAAGYRLPPVMLTLAEATALLTAEKLAEQFTDAATAQLSRSAMDKVRAVLRHSDRAYLQHVTPHIRVRHPVPVLTADSSLAVRQTLETSLGNRQLVWIEYRTGYEQQLSQREIEPIGLYFHLHWHVVAFCRLRQQVRDFRLDRIASLQLRSEQFAARPETLDSYFAQQQEQTQQTVVLHFAAQARPLIRDDKYYFGWVTEEPTPDGGLTLTLAVPQLRELAHWVLYFGAAVRIISPPALQQEVLALARTAWQHHAEYEPGN